MFVEAAWSFENRICFVVRNGSDAEEAMEAAYDWCAEQFGPQAFSTWEESSDEEFCFRNPTFALAFKLRWC